jgi:hypothetical protein
MRPAAEAPPRPASRRDFALGLTFVLLAFVGLVRAFAPHTVDDAWITFRYSRMWAEGHGPVFNPGEHVEGYSNFLLVALLAPIIRNAGPDAALPVAKGAGLVSALLAIVATGLLARRAAKSERWADVAGIAAAALVACTTGFSYHAMNGLETTLYACLLAWGVLGLASELDGGVMLGGLALALASIARPEAPLVCGLACGVALLVRARTAAGVAAAPALAPSWRAPATAALLVCVAVLGQLAFRRFTYDGAWLPNTLHALSSGADNRLVYVHDAFRGAFLGDLGLLLALVGWLFGGRPSRASLLPAVAGLAGGLLPLASGGDAMPAARLVVPYLPLLAITVSLGWARLLARARRGGTGVLSAVLLLSAPLGLAFQWPARAHLAEVTADETRGENRGRAALAGWLERRAAPGDAVVLADIGEVGYRCIDQRIVDVTGITDRTIGQSPGPLHDKHFDLGYVWSKQPAFVVIGFTGAPPMTDAAAPPHESSPIETRLALDPIFERDFMRALPPPDSTRHEWREVRTLSAADTLFEYVTPEHTYQLAVYRRRS